MDFKRRENETRNQFIYRVYKFQEDTGSINNLEAMDICNKELNETFGESAYRKKYQDFMNMFSDLKDIVITESDALERIKEIEKREDDLYKQKVKTSDKLRELRANLRTEARIENLKDLIIQSVQNAPILEIKDKKLQLNGDAKALLSLSDLHYGMVTDNYWNEYNTAIAKKRLEKLLYETIKYCEIMNVGTIYVCNLNDLVNGNIHVSSRIQSEEDVIEQTMHVAELLSNFLLELESYGLKVIYSSTTDNHGRTNKYNEHIEKENFCKIIDWYIKSRVSNKVKYIENLIDESITHFEVDSKNIFCVHGHLDNPNSVLSDMALGTRIIPDIVLMGHYHNRKEMNKGCGKVIVNGSICGVDEYAKNKRFIGGSASQNLTILDNGNFINIEIALQEA